MSAEQLNPSESWTIKVVEIGSKGAEIKQVKISRDSKDSLSKFVVGTLDYINEKIAVLSIPVKKVKGYGGRRPSRELRDIRAQREKQINKLQSARELLTGKTNQVILFSTEGNKFLGFDRWHQKNGASETKH